MGRDEAAVPLDDAEQALKEMHRGSIHGRAVLVMD
jgi:D-arabinose 1-dehydrogenase-like Zn-dependent alcohol dehydrogenase